MTAIPALAATPLLALLALSDLRHHRIRNRDIAALAVITAATVLAVAVPVGVGVVGDAIVGAALAASPLLAAWVVQPARMGGGDVKLAALLGALLGPLDLWLAVAAVGAALTVTLVAARRGLRRWLPRSSGRRSSPASCTSRRDRRGQPARATKHV